MKTKLLACIFLFCINNVYAEVLVTIEIRNINLNFCKIFGGIYYSETSYKNNLADIDFQTDPISQTIVYEIMLPEREGVIGIFQDKNGNEILDHGIFNIPKEPVGITNYTGGIPSNFSKLKINISK
jgi:uncharacterized protein (DUF2141 family)